MPDKLLKGMFLFCLLKLFLWAFFVMLDCIRGLLCLGGRNCIDYPRTSKDSKVYQNASGDFFVGDQKHFKKFPKKPEDFRRWLEKLRRFSTITGGRQIFPKVFWRLPKTTLFTSNQLFSCIFRIFKFLKTDVILISLILFGPMLLPTRIVFELHMVPSTPPKAG